MTTANTLFYVLPNSKPKLFLNWYILKLIWRLKESMVLQMNGRYQHQSYLPKAQKTLTFARVFTNIEPANAYQNLFKDLFCCVEKDIGETFNFLPHSWKGIGMYYCRPT